jgi:uncharacterized repeat protein (TIGR01451 family)
VAGTALAVLVATVGTASARIVDPEGGEVASLGALNALTIDKTASGQYDNTYQWTIAKQVRSGDGSFGPSTTLDLPDGGSGTVDWRIVVGGSVTQANHVVSGTIVVTNSGYTNRTNVSVTDSLPGAVISCGGGGSTGLTVLAHSSLTCSYSVSTNSQVTSNTASVTWGGGTASDTATISWSARPGSGSAQVDDNSSVFAGPVTVAFGDLVGGQKAFEYSETWRCANGQASPNSGRVNTATVTWNGGQSSASASASVSVGCGSTPPPTDVCPNLPGDQATVPPGMVIDGNGNCVTPPVIPPPTVKPDESMDVQVIKDATAQVQLVNGQADIAYTVRVRNNGPNQAHDVQLADAAPGGVTFLAVTQQPVGGTCTITPALLSCSLGTLGLGVERTIGFTARVTQTGTYVNTATATGQGKDTNSANNTDSAQTVVVAPVTPPTPQPKPEPTPKPKPTPKPVVVCSTLKVGQKMLTASGARQVIRASVLRKGKPVAGARVSIVGPGIRIAVRTNAQGVAIAGVHPRTAGIIRLSIVNKKGCNTARVGVIGAFEPPVTG